jgi:hypothetical protein
VDGSGVVIGFSPLFGGVVSLVESGTLDGHRCATFALDYVVVPADGFSDITLVGVSSALSAAEKVALPRARIRFGSWR